jgi:hypothetical protein
LQINKTENINSSKSNLEPLAKKTDAAKSTTVKTSVTISASRSVMSLINSLGLPSDKLSASIISFTRFFSLPLKGEQLAAIRRQAFTQSQSETPQAEMKQSTAKNSAASLIADKNRVTLILTATAAESKGVELQPKALLSFAEAVDPEWQRRSDADGQKHEQRNRNQEQKDENTHSKTGAVNSSGLEKLALESAEKNPLLYLLNRLPGKNGQRWIVLPFDISQDGKDFHVSMRILLETKQDRAVLMALDIAETTDTDNRWLFAIESANNQIVRLSVFVKPDLPQKVHSSIKRELSLLLGIPSQRVSVKSRLDDFPCESAFTEDLLRSIDEAV